MSGEGVAGGAGTIVNAMATGRGVAFGLSLRVRVRVHEATTWSVLSGARRLSPARARLAVESAKRVVKTPLRIEVESNIPPERGLKSSSAVAVATINAAAEHADKDLTDQQILEAAAEAGIRSGTSLTGAFDDASACHLGGVVFTHNPTRTLLRRRRLPSHLVVLVHPGDHTLRTAQVARFDFSPIAPLVEQAELAAQKREYRNAMLLNTAAYAPLFGHRSRFTAAAIAAGAYAAGLSGKGPAEIALAPRPLAARLRTRFPGSMIVDLQNGRTRP